MSSIKLLYSIHKSTNEKAREDTQRNPATKASWI